MNNITAATAWTVTDMIGTCGTTTVTVDTTADEFAAWYGMEEVRSQLVLVLDGIQTGSREQGLEDMLGLSVEQD